jgi:hypothetical protein
MAPGVINTITNLAVPEMVFTRKSGGSFHVTTASDGSGIFETKGQTY